VQGQPGYTGYSVKNDKGMRLILRAGYRRQHQAELLLLMEDAGRHRRRLLPRQHRELQHVDREVERPDRAGAGQHGGSDDPGHPDADRQRSSRALGHRLQMREEQQYQGQSPRVFPIPLYDPMYYAEGKANGRVADFKVANFLGFFAEYISGNEIFGYVTTVTGIVAPVPGGTPAGLFPVAIRLVE
jgi:hypothetical protein